MQAALVGWPLSGADSIFSALTGLEPLMSGALEDRQGAALVPDERLDYLSGKFNPQKHTPARVDFQWPQAQGEPQEALKTILDKARVAEALIIVVNNFQEPKDPWTDAKKLLAELVFNDYLSVEKRLERLAEERKRGKKNDPEEVELLTQAQKLLEAEKPLRETPAFAQHPKLRGFGLLSAKPALVVVNNPDEEPELPVGAPEGLPTIAVRGQLEAELAQMDAAEAQEFLADYGLKELAKDRVIREIYKLMGLISFFTVGEDECRAWTIKNGESALEAAGAIHSDIKKGFIRAEVVAYEAFKAAGSFAEVKKQGQFRLEGKTYLVQDGDIVHFRFNV